MTYSTIAVRSAAAAVMALAAAPSMAQTTTYGTGTVALGGTTYTQDFNTLTSGSALPPGWRASETGSNADSTYVAGTGSSNAGNVYNFGTAGSTDRALGTLLSGTLAPRIGAIFSNATNSTITSLVFGYTGEQWRNGGGTARDMLDFQYSLTSTNIADGPGSAAWLNFDALDFTSPNNTGTVGALDGNVFSTVRNGTLSNLTIAANSSFAIRWLDIDIDGADDGLAVDDFSLSAITAAVPEPGTWAMMIVGFGVMGGSLRRRRRIVAFA